MAKNLLKEVMVKAQVKHQVPSFDIEGLREKIESGYLVGRETKNQKKKTFAPSTLVYGHGECARYWYLAFEGGDFQDYSKPFDVANMNNGTLSHGRIQEALLKSGIAKGFIDEDYLEETGKEKLTTEFKIFHSDPPIFGYGDGLINWNEEEMVVEIKTSPSDGFEYRKNNNKPKTGHLMQLLIYMKILKKQKGVLIYENKNTHELLLFPIEVNSHYIRWVDQAFDWMRVVRQAWKGKTLPQKNYRSNSKICKACPLQKMCADAGDGVVKIKSLEPLENEKL